MSDVCKIRRLALQDLPTVLIWRNHPSVRSFMFSQHEITSEEHRAWFERTSGDPTRRLLIVEDGEGPLGFVQFSDVVVAGIADWGFYARPDAPKGTGRRLGTAALDYAFTELRLHKVCGQAITANEASIAMHRRLGFVEEGILRDQKYVNGTYHSLICFGLLKHEWRGMPQNRTL